MKDVLTIQGEMVNILLRSPGKLSIFPVLALFPTCPSLKSGTPTLTKILLWKSTRIDVLAHKVWSLEIENGSLRRHLKLGVFDYIFSIIGK